MKHPTSNFPFPQKVLWHVKVFAGAIFIAFMFGLILQGKLIHGELPVMISMTFFQLEIFIWLGFLFFESVKTDEPDFRRKIVARLLLFYLTVLVIAFLLFITIFSVGVLIKGGNLGDSFSGIFNNEMKGFVIATLVGFAFGALVFFYVQWTDALKREQTLKQEKLIFQYETLKSQVNPHFLFNSLNTLSSLVGNNSELAEKFIQKLSSVYRYVLDNKEKELVPLESEIDFVKNYFYLQQIRDEEKIKLNVEINDLSNVDIVPVSLQLLVENALKHNVATRKNPLLVIIHDEGTDKLVVRNNIQKKTQLNDSSKIGLKNLNERCRLILHREINIEETKDEFVVKVPVKFK